MGDTTDGVADMTGNVHDWTSSAYLPYPYAETDDRNDTQADEVRRVTRGGSWLMKHDHATASFRQDMNPDARARMLGFRVACDRKR